jgi:two-component system sensor histidine kinase/response regulator
METMMRQHRIIIVDDNPVTVKLIRSFLKNQYRLEVAGSGEEALEIIPKFRPDLVLLDIMLPEMNGYEVCQKIRQDDRFKLIKVLLVSAKTSVEERLAGYQAGADDYVTKPFVNAELNAKIRVFLQLKRVEEIEDIKSTLFRLYSQETRSRLNQIIDLAEGMRDNPALPEDESANAGKIADYAYQVFDYLLKHMFLSELKSGMALSFTMDSLGKHLNDSMALLKNEAAAKGVAFSLEGQMELSAPADWSNLNKAFLYVLDNAVKFSPTNGTITVKVKEKNDDCVIRIIDEGKGIDTELIHDIFSGSIENINDDKPSSAGLSLAISRYIFELHGGSIEAENDSKKGAVFTIRLPLLKG